ncbi:MAG TPA: hypothetical protein VGP07_03340 [Polyangia bacterium]|jgi:hypothetical protein
MSFNLASKLRLTTLAISCGLALGALGLTACSSSSSSGGGGQGGATVPTGGASGALGGTTGGGGTSGGGLGGSAGAAGGSTGAAGGTIGTTGDCGDLPACIADVISGCVPAGTCLVAASGVDTTSTHDICYGDGIKAVNTVTNDINAGTGINTITFYKAGATCYSLSSAFDSSSLTRTYTLTNADGVAVGTLNTVTANGTVTSVTCGAVTTPITDSGTCMPAHPEVDDCLGGRCVL